MSDDKKSGSDADRTSENNDKAREDLLKKAEEGLEDAKGETPKGEI
jgi:hypothetical protein